MLDWLRYGLFTPTIVEIRSESDTFSAMKVASVLLALSAIILSSSGQNATTAPQAVQYTLREITIDSYAIPAKYVRQAIPMKDGQVFDPALLAVGIDKLMTAYRGFGYLRAACTPKLVRDEPHRTVSVHLVVDEGKQFSVASAMVEGLDSEDYRSALEEIFGKGKVYNGNLAELFFKHFAPPTLADVPPNSRIRLALHDENNTVDVIFDFRAPKKN